MHRFQGCSFVSESNCIALKIKICETLNWEGQSCGTSIRSLMVMIRLQLSFLDTECPFAKDIFHWKVDFVEDRLLPDIWRNENGCALDLQCQTNPFFSFYENLNILFLRWLKNCSYIFTKHTLTLFQKCNFKKYKSLWGILNFSITLTNKCQTLKNMIPYWF